MNSRVLEHLNNIYESYKRSEDATWNNEIQPKIEEINAKYNSFFDDDKQDKNKELNFELNRAKENYKKGFNHAGYWMLNIFGLFFSFILIIPFYWAFKKHKQMKNKKAELQEIVEEATEDKIDFLYDAASELDLTSYMEEMLKITKYENCGPLHDAVVKYVRNNSLFRLDNNRSKNTLSSTWGIFDKNKIVVNIQETHHYMIKQEYRAHTTVSDGDRIITVTASIYKDKPIFDYSSSNWFYMSSCSNLELKLLKTYPSRNRNLGSYDVPLDNQNFDKSFKWESSDPIQLRMLFTPYTQELYVDNAFYNKEFRSNYNLRKIKSFISNTHYTKNISLINSIKRVINDPNTNLNDLEITIRSTAIKKIHESYLGLTPGWVLPIMQSENHTDALFLIKNSKKIPDLSTFHFILNSLFKYNVVSGDTDTFHTIENTIHFLSSYGDQIYGAKMQGLSFKTERRWESVSKYAGGSYVTIDVPYIHYEPLYGLKNIYMTYIDNKWTHSTIFSLIRSNRHKNLSDELAPIIHHYGEQGIGIVVDKNILAVICDNIPQQSVIKIFDEIIPVVKKYNL